MGFFFNPRLDLVAFSQFGKYQSKPTNSPFFHYLGIVKSSLCYQELKDFTKDRLEDI